MTDPKAAPAPDMEQAVREVPSKKACPDCFVYPDGSFRCDMNCGPSIPVQPDPLGIEAALRMTRGHLKLSQPTSKLPQHPESVMETAEDRAKSQGLCDTTNTERFENGGCMCPTYEGNLGPCRKFTEGGNGRCVYCDHTLACHLVLGKRFFNSAMGAPVESVLDVQGGGFEEWWAGKFVEPKNDAQKMVKSTAYHAWSAGHMAASAASTKWVMQQAVKLFEVGVKNQFGVLINERAEKAEAALATLAASPSAEDIFAMNLPPECSAWWRAAGQWHKELQEAQEEIARLKSAVAPAPQAVTFHTDIARGFDPAAVSGEPTK